MIVDRPWALCHIAYYDSCNAFIKEDRAELHFDRPFLRGDVDSSTTVFDVTPPAGAETLTIQLWRTPLITRPIVIPKG